MRPWAPEFGPPALNGIEKSGRGAGPLHEALKWNVLTLEELS
jgi:hypothetical protein